MTLARNFQVLGEKEFVEYIKSKPPAKQSSWKSARKTFIAGGCEVINIDNEVAWIEPCVETEHRLIFEIPSYGSLYQALAELDLTPFVTEFIHHKYQIEGSMPAESRACFIGKGDTWILETQCHIWSQVAAEAARQKDSGIWDCASRISHQLRATQYELDTIASAYSRQLKARLISQDYENGQLFADMFTDKCYQAIQNYLINACILRDYLAEFYFKFCISSQLRENHSVTTMSALKKKVLTKTTCNDPLFLELKAETSKDGWIKELGDYRDMAAHSVPLAKVLRHMFIKSESKMLLKKYEVPGIRCPLPNSPAEIKTERAKGQAFIDFENQWRKELEIANGPDAGQDGMKYAHTTSFNLAKLAEKIVAESPIEPKMQIIDESMVIGEIKVTGDGSEAP